MAIRIDIESLDSEGDAIVVRVAGRLTGAAGAQLTEACESKEGNVVLDLSMLMFADDAGVEAIRTLREQGAEIRGASSFIRLLINDVSGHK